MNFFLELQEFNSILLISRQRNNSLGRWRDLAEDTECTGGRIEPALFSPNTWHVSSTYTTLPHVSPLMLNGGFYKISIYPFHRLLKRLKRVVINSDPLFSLLVTCYGKTSWNQNGRVKSQVYLAAWRRDEVRSLPVWRHD